MKHHSLWTAKLTQETWGSTHLGEIHLLSTMIGRIQGKKQAFGLGFLVMELSLVLIFSREISMGCLICRWSTNLPFREFVMNSASHLTGHNIQMECFLVYGGSKDGAPSHGFRPVRQKVQVLFPGRVVASHEATE